jgi:catechol 2,3-dioxygenase-like lactoylglutathione lyase family enzyme
MTDMDDSAAKSSINEIGTIFVPVKDQDRSLEFFVGKLGFEKRIDFVYGVEEVRWIEVAPPGAGNTISLVPADEGTAPSSDRTFCAFGTTDIEADHALIKAAGVEVDESIATQGGSRQGLIGLDATITDPVPAQFLFRDPDGNRFLIVQPG